MNRYSFLRYGGAYPVAVAVWAYAMASSALAQISYPMVMSIRPIAVTQGTTSEHEIVAVHNLYGAYKVEVTGNGVTAEAIPPEMPPAEGTKPTADRVKLKFTVSPDALPGVRDVRVATPQGASTVGQLVVTPHSVFAEQGDNNKLELAQQVPLPVAICGAFEAAEDTDFYKLAVKAGQRLTLHVRCGRLEDRIHDLQTHADPILTLRNATGGTLAMNDNHFAADPLLSYVVPADGELFVEIRDVRYQSNDHWRYCLEITDGPLVLNTYPVAVSPQTATDVELLGPHCDGTRAFLPLAAPAAESVTPATAALAGNSPGNAGQVQWTTLRSAGVTNAFPVFATLLPTVLELPPAEAGVLQEVSLPGVINGQISAPGEIDKYQLHLNAGDVLSLQVFARRCQSPLDANLRVFNADGVAQAENDDLSDGNFVYADSWIESWTAPAAGAFIVEIRDLQLRGGPEFVYAIAIDRATPYFALTADTDKTLLQPGGSSVIFVRAKRKNGFAGEVQLAVEGLPAGVTASCGKILADGTDGCIVLTAAPDAAMASQNIQITGTGTHISADGSSVPLAAKAMPLQEIYAPGGGRTHFRVETHAVSVCGQLDIASVKLSANNISLKPGESAKVDVTIERAAGFDKNVTLDVVYQHLSQIYGNSLPKGVTLNLEQSKVLLTGQESAGYLTLVAAPDAPPVTEQQVPVMAHVSINFVMKATYTSEPLWISVLPKE